MLRGLLFTQNFLLEGITGYDEWKHINDETLEDLKVNLTQIYSNFPTEGKPNESTTERDLIEPVIRALG